ncbi:questin oxidase family protein [Flocculibacter collagenilyticus]|uniref:questin oxidase family protein n=1 Tax=Flocculibacter collagenilyticus TaxID=2744479 RepID=UPI0018F4954C|nr:questin oxidase family protein [Flocculibacter collagenilyticus]
MNKSNNLSSLLDEAGQFHPLYGKGLATHLPMVLIALNRLNASDAKLARTFSSSIHGLDRIGSLENITPVKDISNYLGSSKQFKSYLRYFKNELALKGMNAVLTQSLPVLIRGLSASAFHSLIRLAYAVEASNESEAAIALAYWCAEYQPFALNESFTTETLEEILLRVAPIGVNHAFSPGIIVDRMNEIGELLNQQNIVIQPERIDLATVRTFALNTFCAQDDFTLLHTVTGCHALSMLLPYLDNEELAIRELWKGILVAYLSTGLSYDLPEIKPMKEKVDFQPLINKAILSDDSHVIKLTYTCFCEFKKHENPVYYKVAKRAVEGS